jgi:pimeloyl-ACP methyl ester carboxylesterase
MVDSLAVATPFGAIDTRADGDGPPVVFLPGDTGRGPWSPFLSVLAASRRVFAPALPGFDGTPQLDWLRDVRQLAAVMAAYVRALDAGPVALVGRGLGAWVAAELLAGGAALIGDAVLVAPVGVRPTSGEYVDQFLIGSDEWVRLGFSTDERFVAEYGTPPAEPVVDAWELNREMTTRIAWKPYLHDLALPHLLAGVRSRVLVVRAEGDRIVPASVAERYATLIPGASFEQLDGGHFLDIEQPDQLAAVVLEFLAKG